MTRESSLYICRKDDSRVIPIHLQQELKYKKLIPYPFHFQPIDVRYASQQNLYKAIIPVRY